MGALFVLATSNKKKENDIFSMWKGTEYNCKQR